MREGKGSKRGRQGERRGVREKGREGGYEVKGIPHG